jgi:hypothetical protein
MRSATLWRDKLSLLLGLMKGNKSSSPADIYSETDYRDLVRRELKRSERSGHLCRILLVYWPNIQGLAVPLGSELASKIIAILSEGIRDTDYIGWYRQRRIVGVLLTVLRSDSSGGGCDSLKTRLMDSLHSVPGVTGHCSLQIRVLEPCEITAFSASDDTAPFPADSKG